MIPSDAASLFQLAGLVNVLVRAHHYVLPRINAARQLREQVSDLERLEIHSVEQAEGWGT